MMSRHRGALALASLVLCACGDSPAGPPDAVGLRIVAGADLADTIDASFTQAVVAELRDSKGQPIVDHLLRFTTVPVESPDQFFIQYTAYVSPADRNEYGVLATDRTDSQGRARVLVRLGRKAGPALVIVSDPDQGTADTATLTVRPGNGARVVAEPADTSIYVGKAATIRGSVVDRAGNPRTDPVSYSVVGSAVTLSGSTATGAAIGVARVIATAGTVADTTTVSVPPEAILAAFTPRGLATFKTDGSEFTLLVPNAAAGTTTAWSPSGTEVAFDRPYNDRLQIATLTGSVRAISTSSAWSIYPEYSPDGQWVYYSREGWRLHRVHPDGTGDELVPMTTPATDAASSVSPNGTQVVYVRIGGGDQLWMLDLATGASTNLNVPGHQPEWSPNGSLIAFLALNDNNQIKVMNPDGTGVRTVGAGDGRYSFGHDWSPDGQWIVARNGARNRLEVINVATGQIIPLGATAGYGGPSWKP